MGAAVAVLPNGLRALEAIDAKILDDLQKVPGPELTSFANFTQDEKLEGEIKPYGHWEKGTVTDSKY